MNKNCGCGSSGGLPTPDFHLMAASPQSASTCGEGQVDSNASQDCLLGESTFDRIVGAYTIPALNTSAPVQVCNGSLYSVGQWVQFVGDGSSLQIVSIIGTALQLRNGCSNQAPIKGNSNPGTIIQANTPLVPVGEPECLTEEEALNELLSALANAQTLCMPNLLAEASETSKMHLLGWRKEDPNNSDYQKCIQWLSGIWKTAKSLFIKPIETSPELGDEGADDWRPLVIHKTTGEVRQQLNASENTDLEAGEKYVLMIVEGKQALVGPAYIYVPAFKRLYNNYSGAMTDESLWLNIPHDTPLVQSISLSITEINSLEILGDKFYAHINVNLGIDQPAGYGHQATLEVNGDVKGMVGCKGGPMMNQIHLIVEVEKASKKIDIKVTTKGQVGSNPKCHVSVDLMGVQL